MLHSTSSSICRLGTPISQGLPNIQGVISSVDNFRLTVTGAVTPSGAFTAEHLDMSYFPSNVATSSGPKKFIFNASNSNPIYGSSNSVTPLSLGVQFLIRY